MNARPTPTERLIVFLLMTVALIGLLIEQDREQRPMLIDASAELRPAHLCLPPAPPLVEPQRDNYDYRMEPRRRPGGIA